MKCSTSMNLYKNELYFSVKRRPNSQSLNLEASNNESARKNCMAVSCRGLEGSGDSEFESGLLIAKSKNQCVLQVKRKKNWGEIRFHNRNDSYYRIELDLRRICKCRCVVNCHCCSITSWTVSRLFFNNISAISYTLQS